MRTTRVPVSPCPTCRAPNDAAMDADGEARPVPGDLTVCVQCATVVVYDDELQLQLPSPDLVLDADTKVALDRIVRAVQLLRRVPA
jgi:hypothetical protein